MPKEVFLDSNTMIVSETDEKGIVLYANADFCKIAGYTKEELIGMHHNIVRHPDMPKAAFADLWKTIKQGKVWKGIVKNSTKAKDYYWVFATVYSSCMANGKTRYISVRKAATKEQILQAQTLYATLS